jgi:hypothetical protein
VTKQDELAKEINLAFLSIFFILRRVLQHAVKSYDMKLTVILLLGRKEGVLRNVIAL